MPPGLLFVDGGLSELELRRSSLNAHGYSVLTANTLHSALQVLQNEPVAVVLVEYKGDGMDGETVVLSVKQQFPTMPVVLLSAYSDLPGWLLWLVDDYVMGGEPLEVLLGVVGRLAGASPARNVAIEDKRRTAAA